LQLNCKCSGHGFIGNLVLKKLFFPVNPFYEKIPEKQRNNCEGKIFFNKKVSPFLLLSIFLVFYLFYAIFTKTITRKNIYQFPFIIANSIYIDIALWNYFRGKRKGIIWIIESVIAALVIRWVT
jgi:hypothetical protein